MNKIEMNTLILNHLERTLDDDLQFDLLMYESFYSISILMMFSLFLFYFFYFDSIK